MSQDCFENESTTLTRLFPLSTTLPKPVHTPAYLPFPPHTHLIKNGQLLPHRQTNGKGLSSCLPSHVFIRLPLHPHVIIVSTPPYIHISIYLHQRFKASVDSLVDSTAICLIGCGRGETVTQVERPTVSD